MHRSFWAALVLAALVIGLPFGCGGRPGERDFRNGVKEIDRGNYVRGITLLEKSITKRPGSDDNAIAYNLLGVACWKLGQVQRATEAFEYSRRLSPTLFEPTYNLASLLFEGGDLARAATLLEEAAVLDTQDPRALELLGKIHMDKGEWQEARRVLFGAYARSPQSPRVLTALGVIESRTGGADKAIFYLMQALEKKPSYAPAIFNLAVLYQRELKDNEQAIAYYRRFLESPGIDAAHVEQAMQGLEELGAGQPKPPPAPEPIVAPPVVQPVVTPPPGAVPLLTVEYSRNTLSLPMTKRVGSPAYFKSCGGEPMTAPEKNLQPSPISVCPSNTTCAPTSQLSPSVTCSPMIANGPIVTFSPMLAHSCTMAV